MQEQVSQQTELELIPMRKTNFWKITSFILLFFLMFLSVMFFIYLKKQEWQKTVDVERVLKIEDERVTGLEEESNGSQIVMNSDSNKYTYLLKEFRLLGDSQELAKSQLFGFRFGKFHKDWECKNGELQYTADGITVVCRQKPCSLTEGVGFSAAIKVEKSQECSDELERREFSGSVLSDFEINISPIYVENEQVLADVEDFNPNKTTLGGYPYQLNVVESDNNRETGYIRQYEIVFYSSKTISDFMSNYTGTYYGSEEIYAKYQIVVDIYDVIEPEKELTEEKYLELISKMIDSIEFLEQPNSI